MIGAGNAYLFIPRQKSMLQGVVMFYTNTNSYCEQYVNLFLIYRFLKQEKYYIL